MSQNYKKQTLGDYNRLLRTLSLSVHFSVHFLSYSCHAKFRNVLWYINHQVRIVTQEVWIW